MRKGEFKWLGGGGEGDREGEEEDEDRQKRREEEETHPRRHSRDHRFKRGSERAEEEKNFSSSSSPPFLDFLLKPGNRREVHIRGQAHEREGEKTKKKEESEDEEEEEKLFFSSSHRIGTGERRGDRQLPMDHHPRLPTNPFYSLHEDKKVLLLSSSTSSSSSSSYLDHDTYDTTSPNHLVSCRPDDLQSHRKRSVFTIEDEESDSSSRSNGEEDEDFSLPSPELTLRVSLSSSCSAAALANIRHASEKEDKKHEEGIHERKRHLPSSSLHTNLQHEKKEKKEGDTLCLSSCQLSLESSFPPPTTTTPPPISSSSSRCTDTRGEAKQEKNGVGGEKSKNDSRVNLREEKDQEEKEERRCFLDKKESLERSHMYERSKKTDEDEEEKKEEMKHVSSSFSAASVEKNDKIHSSTEKGGRHEKDCRSLVSSTSPFSPQQSSSSSSQPVKQQISSSSSSSSPFLDVSSSSSCTYLPPQPRSPPIACIAVVVEHPNMRGTEVCFFHHAQLKEEEERERDPSSSSSSFNRREDMEIHPRDNLDGKHRSTRRNRKGGGGEEEEERGKDDRQKHLESESDAEEKEASSEKDLTEEEHAQGNRCERRRREEEKDETLRERGEGGGAGRSSISRTTTRSTTTTKAPPTSIPSYHEPHIWRHQPLHPSSSSSSSSSSPSFPSVSSSSFFLSSKKNLFPYHPSSATSSTTYHRRHLPSSSSSPHVSSLSPENLSFLRHAIKRFALPDSSVSLPFSHTSIAPGESFHERRREDLDPSSSFHHLFASSFDFTDPSSYSLQAFFPSLEEHERPRGHLYYAREDEDSNKGESAVSPISRKKDGRRGEGGEEGGETERERERRDADCMEKREDRESGWMKKKKKNMGRRSCTEEVEEEDEEEERRNACVERERCGLYSKEDGVYGHPRRKSFEFASCAPQAQSILSRKGEGRRRNVEEKEIERFQERREERSRRSERPREKDDQNASQSDRARIRRIREGACSSSPSFPILGEDLLHSASYKEKRKEKEEEKARNPFHGKKNMTTSLAKREEDSPAGTQGGSYLFFLLPGYSDTFFYGVSCYRRVSAKPWYPSAGPAATVRCGVCLVGQAPFWGVFLFRLAPVACAFFQSLSRSSAYSSFFSLRSSSSLWLGDKRNDAYKKDHKICETPEATRTTRRSSSRTVERSEKDREESLQRRDLNEKYERERALEKSTDAKLFLKKKGQEEEQKEKEEERSLSQDDSRENKKIKERDGDEEEGETGKEKEEEEGEKMSDGSDPGPGMIEKEESERRKQQEKKKNSSHLSMEEEGEEEEKKKKIIKKEESKKILDGAKTERSKDDEEEETWKQCKEKKKNRNRERKNSSEDLLVDLYRQMNSLRFDQMRYTDLFFNLEGSFTPFTLLFHPKWVFLLVKAFLLERKILFFSHSPARASSAVLAFVSLFPGVLNLGFNSDGFGRDHFKWRLYGFPFHLFHSRCILCPYLSLSLIDDILLQKRGFLAGTSHPGVCTHPVVRPDILVYLDEVRVEVRLPSLAGCLELTLYERNFSLQVLQNSRRISGNLSTPDAASPSPLDLLPATGASSSSSSSSSFFLSDALLRGQFLRNSRQILSLSYALGGSRGGIGGREGARGEEEEQGGEEEQGSLKNKWQDRECIKTPHDLSSSSLTPTISSSSPPSRQPVASSSSAFGSSRPKTVGGSFLQNALSSFSSFHNSSSSSSSSYGEREAGGGGKASSSGRFSFSSRLRSLHPTPSTTTGPPSLSSPSSTFSSSSSSPFSPSYTSSPLPPSSCSSFPSPPSSSLYANISSSSSPNSREVFFLDPQESTSDGPPQPSPGNDSHRFLTPDAPHTSKKLRETRDEGRKRFSFFHLKPGKRCSTSSSSLQADGSGGNDPIEWLYGEEDIPPPYQRGEEEDLSSTSLPGKESRGENKMATRQGRGGGEDEEEALDKQKKEEEKISGDDEETRRKERQREDERDSTGQHHIDSKSGRKTDHDRHAKHKDSLPQGHLFSSSSSHAQESSSFSSPRKHLEKREEKTNPFAAGEEEEGERRGGLQQTALSPFSDMTSDNRLDGRETRAMGASKSKDEERPTGVLSSSSSFSSSSAWKSCAGVGGALAQFSRFAFLKKLTTTAQGLPSGIPGEARERGKEEEESENSASSSSLHPTYVLDSSVERTSRHLSSSSSSQLSHLRSRTEIKRGDREKEEQEEEQEERRLIRREGRRKEGEEERGLHREGEGGARATALPTGDATWERAADLFRSAVAYHLELLSRQAAVAAGTQRSAQRFLAEIERQEKEEEDEEKKKKTQTKKEKEAYVPDSDDGRLKKSSGITLSTKDGIEGLRDASKREKRRDMEEEEKKNEASSSFCMGVGKGSLVKNFNPLWLRAWAATHNFQVWLRQHRLPVIVQEEEEREEEEKTSLSPSLIPPPAPPPQEGDVRYVYENRDVYEGQFLKGMRHGHGVYYSKKDGFSYEGEWKEDLRHGEGVLTHDKVGFVYVGQWYKDEKHGEGHLYSSTERYWGTFHHNKYQGKGTYVERVTGAQYEGEFSEGLFHGLGKLSLPSPSSSKEEGKSLGKTIEGHKNKSGRKAFSSSSPHVPLSSRCSRIRVKAPYSSSSLLSAGQGEEEDKETEEDQEREDGGGKKKKKKDASLKGVTICGEWDRGKVRGVATCAYEDGCLYTGTLQEDTLLPEGSGCMSFCDGSSYEGQWKNGRKHGTGVFTCRPSSPSSLFISSSLSKKNNRHEEAEKQEEEDHLHSHTTQEEEERGSFNKGEKRKTDTCSSSSSSSSRDERGGVNGRDDMRPGGYLVYEGVWYEDVPREKAEWIVTFPSGDKYIGCLSMKRSEEKNRYMKKEKEKQKKRRETERICATEGGEGGEREKEEEKGERMGGEDTEKKKEKEEEKERYDISEEEEKEEEEEDYSMYVVPHGEGLSKHKALGETYEGQWMYGARHGQGESISSEGVRYLGGWQCGYEHGEGLLVNTDTQKQYEGKFLYGRFISRDSSHLHTKKNKKDEEEEKKREEEEDEEEERRDVTKFSHKRKILFYESFLVYPIHLSPFFWESSTH